MLQSCYDLNNAYEIGVDEAGRGPLFGRLYVGAVILPKGDNFKPTKNVNLQGEFNSSGSNPRLKEADLNQRRIQSTLADSHSSWSMTDKDFNDAPEGRIEMFSGLNRFKHEWMKDSKKFHSKKKIREVAEYVKQNAIAWSVQYVEADIIDEINIRQAVFRGMHAAIQDVICINKNKNESQCEDPFLLIDGNDFKLYSVFDENLQEIRNIPHVTIEGGDNKYTSIAAASILAKVARDTYIEDLCCKYPELVAKYGLDKNQGYGTKKHLDGILEHGITQWHRKTYGRCRESVVNEIIESI